MSRLGGLFLALMGGAGSWFFIYKPWDDMKHQVPHVEVVMRGVVLSIALLLTGIGLMVFGDAAKNFGVVPNGNLKKLTPVGWVMVIVLVGLGFLVNFWLEGQMKVYGYIKP